MFWLFSSLFLLVEATAHRKYLYRPSADARGCAMSGGRCYRYGSGMLSAA